MPITLHWFLPTNGDSRADLSLGNAVGNEGTRIRGEGGADRAPDIGYLGQIARSAEQLGFAGARTPTSSWCEEGWITTAALSQLTERFKFLIAFQPGLVSPTLAAQMAATYQRVSGDRLLLNVVTGGDDHEQRRYGDHRNKVERYARADEFLDIVRRLWTGDVVDFRGDFYDIQGAQLAETAAWPTVYLGGSSREAFEVAAKRADVYLTWVEPPAAVAEKIARARDAADAHGRELRFGIRLHAIARDTSEEAWDVADRLLRGLDPEKIARAQQTQALSGSEGQRRMSALHGGRTDGLEVSPTCGPASAWSAAVPGPHWSAATRRSPTGSRSTTTSGSTSSSSRAIRTWRRPTASARACSRSCGGEDCWRTTAPARPARLP